MRLRQRRRGIDLVVRALEIERLADGHAPQSGDDRQLLFEHAVAHADRRERDTVSPMLGLEPPGTEPELGPTSRHVVDLRDRDRERPGIAEHHRRHERTEPQCRRVAGQARHGRPRVERAGQPTDVAHLQIVLRREESFVAEPFGALCEAQHAVVTGALLRLDEDAVAH